MLKYLTTCFITVFLIATSPFSLFLPAKRANATIFNKPVYTKKPPAGSVCTQYILATERELNIPSGLLLALSIVETGKDGKPYPYAVHRKGRSFYAKTPQQAKSLVTYQNGAYMRNTSVGCMQLQTSYHRKYFNSFEEFISPEANVKYGGNYLKKHYNSYGNWSRAIRRYNGGKPGQTRRYLCKVYDVLKQINPASAKLLDHTSCGKTKPYVSHATLAAYQAFYS